MTLNEWEQSNIEVLTSREMGEWLCRRENRLLDKIRAEIIKHFEGCYLEEDMTDKRKAEHKAYENVLQIIDKYTKGEQE